MLGSSTSFTKWHRRSGHMKKRQVAQVDNAQCLNVASLSRHLQCLSCDFFRRSRRKRMIMEKQSLLDQNPRAQVETPQAHNCPLNLCLTRLNKAPMDTTENHTIQLTNGTLEMMVVWIVFFYFQGINEFV